ncbi:MAG: hypothetical protein ACK5O7_05710 [Holosporales bacterium]
MKTITILMTLWVTPLMLHASEVAQEKKGLTNAMVEAMRTCTERVNQLENHRQLLTINPNKQQKKYASDPFFLTPEKFETRLSQLKANNSEQLKDIKKIIDGIQKAKNQKTLAKFTEKLDLYRGNCEKTVRVTIEQLEKQSGSKLKNKK